VKLAFARLSGRWAALLGAAWLAVSAAGTLGAEPRRDTFESPGRGETLVPGSIVEIRWTAACESDAAATEREEDEAELVLSLDGGMTFPIRVSTEISPCASRVAWRVPALASSQARLGWRTGEAEREDEERIEIVGEPFAILPDAAAAEAEALYARGAEWWTPEPPAPLGAEDAVRTTLGGNASTLAAAAVSIEIGPPSPVASVRPDLRSARAPLNLPTPVRASARSLASSPAAPTPLRC